MGFTIETGIFRNHGICTGTAQFFLALRTPSCTALSGLSFRRTEFRAEWNGKRGSRRIGSNCKD